ncbi:MAG TPA: flagellar basal-body rod protein FlgG [Miltoncostaeaceae bacterium]|nr:flagellar basal-body rod protein FlgG [Miltoncostaeaceae bacterium]
MMNSLYSAATGMRAQQTSMDVVANNLANATTVGFKRDRMDLVDLDYQQLLLAEGGTAQVGLGSAPGQIAKEHEQGAFQQTGRMLDIAIEGNGFLQVVRPDGALAYTRAGNLQIDANGRLGLPGGQLLQPRITVPPGAGDPTIAPDGTVSATVNGTVQTIGRIQTATFANPAGLQAIGDNQFAASANSGAAQVGAPGTNGRGALVQGVIEASNVNVGTEMISLITTQRAFEAASRVVTASDEMMGMANGLRR